MKSISILGCGWLGLPLAIFLTSRGFEVKGSTTDPEKTRQLSQNRIKSFVVNINPKVNGENTGEFLNSEILFINFPPERRDDIEQYHKLQMQYLIDEILKSKIKYVIFASSTSVYPNTNDIVDENCKLQPQKRSGKALLEVENLLLNETNFKTTVLRFAGLVGYDRSPLKSIKRKKMILNPDSKLNLIHRDDCVNISYEIIKNNLWGEIFNACCDKHPARREYYSIEAEQHGIELPEFDENSGAKYKIVDNKKLKKMLGYKFIYPDPLEINPNIYKD